MTPEGTGYLEHLPSDYTANPSKQYPVLFFLHGLGETGTGTPTELNKVKTHGPPKLIEQGHNMCFTINGVQECFIVISPQLKPELGGWWPSVLNELFDFVMDGNQNYRIDRNRVYLTGMSLGGQGVYIGLGETQDIFAGAAVVAGFNNGNGCEISSRQIPVWGLHGLLDGSIPYSTGLTEFSRIGWCSTPVPTAELKWTSYPDVGHNSWNNAYSTDHSIQNPNVYEWLLSKSKGSINNIPVADAGDDITLRLPSNKITLVGSGIDSDGVIMSYKWQQKSGPEATTDALNQSTINLSDLVAGIYVFSLTVVDDKSASSFDEVTITVTPTPTPPTADAGPDLVLTSTNPTNKPVILSGTGVDLDGEIVSLNWKQLSGSPLVLTNDATFTPSITGLNKGIYTFGLTVIDNDGLTGTDDIIITVQDTLRQNLSINKPVTVSSIEHSNFVGSFAVDDNHTTRWSSEFSDNQWIAVDLGEVFKIQTVKIFWENAYGSDFKVQLSNNAENWENAKYVVNNSERLNIIDSLNTEGRYVRILGTKRGTNYGYSIFQLEIFGDTLKPLPPNEPPVANAGTDIIVSAVADSIMLKGTGTDPDGIIITYKWEQIDGPPNILPRSDLPDLSLYNLIEGTYTFRLTVKDNSGLTSYDEVNVFVEKAIESNLALNKPIKASSTEYSGLDALYAVDGDINTRWSSSFNDYNWIYVDLGDMYEVTSVKVVWEKAMAKDYEIQVSQDASTWTTLKTIINNDELINFHQRLNTSARYVRIFGTRRSTFFGYSVYEFEVYGFPKIGSSTGRERSELDESNDLIDIFPVPFKNHLSISGTSHGYYTIKNSSGVTLIEGTYSGHSIDTSHLSKGIYYIDFKYDNRVLRRKLLK